MKTIVTKIQFAQTQKARTTVLVIMDIMEMAIIVQVINIIFDIKQS